MTSQLRDRWSRRDLLVAAAGGGGVALVAGVAHSVSSARQTPVPAAQPLNVLEAIPDSLHASIRNGTAGADLEGYFSRAASQAIAERRPLYVPSGTYSMRTWSPPANLIVLTAGRPTVFKQLDTQGQPQRFIEVAVSGVQLWPGGAATIDGGMTRRGVNATQFNSGVRVHAASGVRIDEFTCGDIYGVDIGGDVLETGCDRNGYLGRCRIGTICGDNVYRNLLSVTGGLTGSVVAVIQTGGCGLMTVDFEPDPSSAALQNWRIGAIRGHRVSVVGDAAAGAGSVTIDDLVMDYARLASTPPFNTAGVSARTSPGLFEVGFRYRNAGSIEIGRAEITGFPRGAIEDIGSQDADSPTERVHFGWLEIRDCGATTGYQVTTQKTRLLDIDTLTAVDKPDPSVATFISGNAMNLVRVSGGEVRGRALYSAEGQFVVRGVTIAGAQEHVFRYARQAIHLDRVTCTGAQAIFDQCSGDILVENSTLQAARILHGSKGGRFVRSRVNGVFHSERRASGDL